MHPPQLRVHAEHGWLSRCPKARERRSASTTYFTYCMLCVGRGKQIIIKMLSRQPTTYSTLLHSSSAGCDRDLLSISMGIGVWECLGPDDPLATIMIARPVQSTELGGFRHSGTCSSWSQDSYNYQTRPVKFNVMGSNQFTFPAGQSRPSPRFGTWLSCCCPKWWGLANLDELADIGRCLSPLPRARKGWDQQHGSDESRNADACGFQAQSKTLA